MITTSAVERQEDVRLDEILKSHDSRILLGSEDQSRRNRQEPEDVVEHTQFMHQSDLGRTDRSLQIFSSWVDLRAGLAECETPTLDTTVMAVIDLLRSTYLEPLFDQLLDLIVVIVLIELRKRRRIIDF